MAITFKPKKSAVRIKRTSTRTARDLGENPFLDPKVDGNLEQSYKAFKAGKLDDATYEVTVQGGHEKYTQTRGKAKGKEGTRLYGDADRVTRLLRAGADELSIGVAIQYVEAKPVGGKPHITIVYMAKQRKAARKPKPQPQPQQ